MLLPSNLQRKSMLRQLFRYTFFLGVLFSPEAMLAQCSLKITNTSGTQNYGCTQVTVTSEGWTGSATSCGKSPYFIGHETPGSYTFNFFPAVTGVQLGVEGIDNRPIGEEEVAFYINGSFYPLTGPGVPDGCGFPAALSATGTLISGCDGCHSSCKNILITETISTLTVEDIYLNGLPAGVVFDLFVCCPICPTVAGMIDSPPINICGNTPAIVPASTVFFLGPGDLLQYILSSDPNDLTGSIIMTSNTPQFAFNPALLQYGTIYYVSAIAGNNVGGNVSLSDDCLSISNVIPVSWNLKPAVTFSIANPNVCGGECTDITATFTGTAPFTLSYSTLFSGVVTETFQDNVSTFQLCVPEGILPTSFVLHATELMDANCSCE